MLFRANGTLLPFEAGAELTAAAGSAELFEGFGFDLADALAGDAEVSADLFEGLLTAVFEAKTHQQHLAFAEGKIVQGIVYLFAQDQMGSGFGRGEGVLVFDEVGEMAVFFFADRGLQGEGFGSDADDLGDTLYRQIEGSRPFS